MWFEWICYTQFNLKQYKSLLHTCKHSDCRDPRFFAKCLMVIMMILSLHTHRKFTYKKERNNITWKVMKSNMCYVCISHFLAIHWPATTVSNHYFPFKTRPKYWFYFFLIKEIQSHFYFFLLYNQKYIHCNDKVILKLCPSLRLVLSLKYFFINLSELYLGRCWFYPAEQKRGTTARRSSHVQQER